MKLPNYAFVWYCSVSLLTLCDMDTVAMDTQGTPGDGRSILCDAIRIYTSTNWTLVNDTTSDTHRQNTPGATQRQRSI